MGIGIVSTFWLLWIVLLWTFLSKFVCGHIKTHFSWIYVLRNGIAGLSGYSMGSFLRNCWTCHRRCPVVHSPQQCTQAPVALHPCYILKAVKLCLIVVLICIFLMIDEDEYLFVCLLAICISSLEKCRKCLLPILKKCVVFLLLSRKSSLYTVDTRPLSDIWPTNIFCHSVGCLCRSPLCLWRPFCGIARPYMQLSLLMDSSSFALVLGGGAALGLSCCLLQDLSSPTRDGTRAPCTVCAESQSLDHQGSPSFPL